jgi:hypothetical protein
MEKQNGHATGTALMERRRRRVLLTGLVAFCVWQIAMLVNDAMPGTQSRIVQQVLIAVGMLGWLFWSVNTWQQMRFQKELQQHPAVAQALNDELTVHNRNKAIAAGFVAVMATQAVIILLSMVWELKAMTAAQLTLMVGVAAMTVAFLLLDRE